MAAELLSRVACHRGCNEPLIVSLRRVTEVGAVDMTERRLKELLAPVIEASHEAAPRREIMRHLRDCLSEPTGKRWQRIYGGLVLIERLAQQGSPLLIAETAHGHHFDLVQKVSLLEHFDSTARGCSDRRAQACVRRKAAELRALLVPKLKKASAEEPPREAGLSVADLASSCSPGSLSRSTTAETSFGSSSRRSTVSADNWTEPGSPPDGRWLDGPKGVPGIASATSLLVERLLSGTGPEAAASSFPREQLQPVLEASHDAEGRQAIMWHLQHCLAEPSAQHWHRVHGGLVLTELLMERGSPLLFTEPTPGVSLDLPRQIWQLEQFELRGNCHAESMVRKKAIELREKMVPWLLNADRDRDEGLDPEACEQIDEAFSAIRFWAESRESTSSSSTWAPAEPSPSKGLLDVSAGSCGEASGREGEHRTTEATAARGGETEGGDATAPRRPVVGNGFEAWSREAGCRTPAAGAFCEAEEGEATADAFFTPLQTPAVAPARGRLPHVISL